MCIVTVQSYVGGEGSLSFSVRVCQVGWLVWWYVLEAVQAGKGWRGREECCTPSAPPLHPPHPLSPYPCITPFLLSLSQYLRQKYKHCIISVKIRCFSIAYLRFPRRYNFAVVTLFLVPRKISNQSIVAQWRGKGVGPSGRQSRCRLLRKGVVQQPCVVRRKVCSLRLQGKEEKSLAGPYERNSWIGQWR